MNYDLANLEGQNERYEELSSVIWVGPFNQFLVNHDRFATIRDDFCNHFH